MYPYYNDYQFKISYNPQNNKVAFARNCMGPQAAVTIAVASYTYTDANSIFVDGTAGNDANAGTQAAPKKTLLNAMNACTATKTKVLITDSLLYAEELTTFSNTYCEGVYAATGQTPTYTLRVLDFTPADGNAIFVDKTGADINAGTQAAPKLTIAGAIAATDGAHQAVVIQDSGTYTEAGFEFTGNFKKLVAASGKTPTVKFTDGFEDYSQFTLEKDETEYSSDVKGNYFESSIVIFDNGYYAIIFIDNSDGLTYGIIYDDSNTVSVGKFQISDFTAGALEYLACALLDNNQFVVVRNDNTDSKGYFTIYDITGTQILGKTKFSDNDAQRLQCKIFSDNDILISYIDITDGNKGKYCVYDTSGSVVVAITTLHNASTLNGSDVAIQSTDDFYYIYSDNVDKQIKAASYTKAGVPVVADTVIDNGDPGTSLRVWNAECLSDDKCAFTYYLTDTGAVADRMAIIDTALNLTGPVDVTTGTATKISLCITKDLNDDISVLFRENDGVSLMCAIYDNTLTEKKAKTTLDASVNENNEIGLLINYDIIIAYCDAADGKGKFKIYHPFGWYGIKGTLDSSIVNGIILDADDNYLMTYLYKGTQSISFSWCEIKNLSNPSDFTSAIDNYAIYNSDTTNILKCSLHDNDVGIYIAANNANVSDNLLYRNSGGYACHIKGTAAVSGDITFEHNTVFDNYNGLRLEDNHGTREIVKNNIIYGNDVYGIYAETAMSYTYSINTNTNYNATAGSGVIVANPLFINEGGYDPTDTDLKLKMRIAGYFADSPAYQLGDETSPDRDAGGWDVVYIGSATTWTSATIEKPVGGIGVSYVPVGEKTLVKKDGTIETAYDSWREVVEFSFVGILNADFTTLVALLMCGNNSVLLYPDPTTYPANYNQYTIIYKEINGDTKNFRLSQTGKQDVKIIMSRAYTP